VQAGTLRVGDVVAAGATHGKVRTLSNAAGAAITSAGPSIAVQLIGLNAVPQAGDEFQVGSNLPVLSLQSRAGLG
jgi:translation initiation factor IF-2